MPRQNELVITLTELIIPQTDTPGAKAAKVNEYIDTVLADATPERSREIPAGPRVDRRAKPGALPIAVRERAAAAADRAADRA